MKSYAIVLITCGSVIGSVTVLCCLCKMASRKRKQTTSPASKVNVITTSVPQQVHHDVKKGQSITKSSGSGTKDGGMVFLAGAGAAIATAAVVAGVNDGGGGSSRGSNSSSDGGRCGGGGCGGGCGGGVCGGG